MQTLLNDAWKFALLPLGSTLEDARSLRPEDWQAIDLPHDWLIRDADHLYADGDGWYRRDLPVEAPEGAWSLRFDGVYMDCDVLLNGETLATHRYGYTAFDVDLTGRLRAGENQLLVHVRHQAPNSRWYSGAGIFRDVTLSALPLRHIAPDGLYVTELPAGLRVQIELTGEGPREALTLQLRDAAGALVDSAALEDTGDLLCAELSIPKPERWSCERPCLYTLQCRYGAQTVALRVGLRETAFDPQRGFLLNGVPTKLRGVCLHHDLGALGSAFNAAAFRRQLRLMKAMGANALRTSHNPPASRALDICDEEGVLVVDEAFDMWEIAKTPFDYARFFPEHWQADVARWVRRDRNHPCVILWSIGNEIPDTYTLPRGLELTQMLRDEVLKHDPNGHAAVTLGSNYMPWAGGQACADAVKLAGYNYGERLYAAHHAAHPDWVIYGSETASMLSSRGVYHFPLSEKVLSEEDLQCSSLGNSATSWGTQDMRACLIDDLNTPWSMGQFLWSGIDYIGEPTPYHTRSCYFGMADTAGFPKDLYYQVKAAWNPEPMVHIGVQWDFNPGQWIDVPVYTNGARCELLLNGASLGIKDVDLRSPEASVPTWRLPFAPGTLTARAYGADGRPVAEDTRRTSGDAVALRLRAERASLRADGEDVGFIEVSAVDAEGRPVENAVNRVRVALSGPIRLLGLDNGDSTDADGYRVDSRCLFSGKLLILVGAKDVPGAAEVRVRSEGLESAALRLSLEAAEPRPGAGRSFPETVGASKPLCRIPARRIELTALGDTHLTPERPECRFAARLLPANADAQPIAFRVVNAAGIESPCAAVETVPGGDASAVQARVLGCGDGQIYLRAVCNNGDAHPRIISQLELNLTGFGKPGLDPYEFVSAGLHDLRHGLVTQGNEKGVAFDREGESVVGFTNVDFGPVGSDRLTLPVFALDGDAYTIELWLGDPLAGGQLLDRLPYQKPCIWNTYQPETWQLSRRVTGKQTICFRMTRKIHLKGFQFERLERAWLPLAAGEADAIYGDAFERRGTAVNGIGNNVTLSFGGMNFGGLHTVGLTLRGSTPLAVNPVQVRATNAEGEVRVSECAFRGEGPAGQRFTVEVPEGICEIAFVFLPGCQFDFDGFQFEQA